jgi:hypothetical protein
MNNPKPVIHDPDFPTPEEQHLSPAYLTSILCCIVVTTTCMFFTASIGLIGWFSVEALKTIPQASNDIGVVAVLASIITGFTCIVIACNALDIIGNISKKQE